MKNNLRILPLDKEKTVKEFLLDIIKDIDSNKIKSDSVTIISKENNSDGEVTTLFSSRHTNSDVVWDLVTAQSTFIKQIER